MCRMWMRPVYTQANLYIYHSSLFFCFFLFSPCCFVKRMRNHRYKPALLAERSCGWNQHSRTARNRGKRKTSECSSIQKMTEWKHKQTIFTVWEMCVWLFFIYLPEKKTGCNKLRSICSTVFFMTHSPWIFGNVYGFCMLHCMYLFIIRWMGCSLVYPLMW